MPITVFETISAVQSRVSGWKQQRKTIGFVPTMGALHDGHVSLVQKAGSQAEIVIASIFVNPTQFNNPDDLLRYPRTPDRDMEMLEKAGCHAVFMPSVNEMYPVPGKGHWDFGRLTSTLEGYYRPGHFDGVCTIVKRLFEVVTPDKAYFGEKDFQQLAVIRSLVRAEHMTIEIIPCPILRESDGLAMSSRNMRLSPEERKTATGISQVLFALRALGRKSSPSKVLDEGRRLLAKHPGIRTEYLEIVNEADFAPIESWYGMQPIALYAGYVGNIRLIDNVRL